MAMRYLGPRFDIHTGGIDNVFPHHEDEIAQSAPIVGDVPARHWVHGEFLLMDGRKMAKSAGNFQRVTELGDRGIDPLAFRYLLLTSRYSRKLEYSDRSLEAAGAALESLRAGLRALGAPPTNGPWAAPSVLAAGTAGDRPEGSAPGVAGHGGDASGYVVTDRATTPSAPLSPDGRAFHDRFVAANDDDLDMPVALALLREILRSTIVPDERRWLVLDADAVLGLDLHRAWETEAVETAVPDEVLALVADRNVARAAGDYPTADGLRARIDALGWDVVDTPAGSEVRPRA
jgi:cysteinyl-tRNA synthetase